MSQCAICARRGTPRKICGAVQPASQNPYPIYDRNLRFPDPIYDRCGGHSCSKHNLCRAFVNDLIDNEEKVASSEKHT